jgi:hypothetical protein
MSRCSATPSATTPDRMVTAQPDHEAPVEVQTARCWTSTGSLGGEHPRVGACLATGIVKGDWVDIWPPKKVLQARLTDRYSNPRSGNHGAN